MKIYSKKNNGLRLLGEGRVFSKKQLVLREFDTDTTSNNNDTVSVNLSPDNSNSNPSDLAKNAQTASTISAPGKKVVGNVNIEDVNGVSAPTISPNDPGSDMSIKANGNSSNDIKNAANAAAKARVANVTVPIRNSVTPRKVMDEMRKNSIPFTKSELTRFLKTI